MLKGTPGATVRSKTLVELADNLMFYARSGAPPFASEKARTVLTSTARETLREVITLLRTLHNDWAELTLEAALRDFAQSNGQEFGKVTQPIRVALTGSIASPGIFEMMRILGPTETEARLLAAAG
jgi:glutamyl-tRNA synthetase